MNSENDEAGMANAEGMTRPELRGAAVSFAIRHSIIISSFVIRASDLIRISDFVIRISRPTVVIGVNFPIPSRQTTYYHGSPGTHFR